MFLYPVIPSNPRSVKKKHTHNNSLRTSLIVIHFLSEPINEEFLRSFCQTAFIIVKQKIARISINVVTVVHEEKKKIKNEHCSSHNSLLQR